MSTQPVELSLESFLECAPVKQDRQNWLLASLSVPKNADVGKVHGEMVLVLDTSGSMYMSGEPIDQVIEATEAVIDMLGPADKLAIVAFDDHGRLVCPLTAGESKNRLRDALKPLKQEGGGATYMRSGLETAMNEIRQNARDPRAVRLVVLTDGEAIDGQDTLDYVRHLERQSVASMGFGDFNFEFMNEVCAPSKGLCKVVKSSGTGQLDREQLRQDFLSELLVAQNTVATNIRLQIEPTETIRLRKSYVVHPNPTFLGPVEIGSQSHYTIDLPGLDRTEGIQIVFDLVHNRREPGECKAATVRVLYDLPGQGLTDQSIEQDFCVEYTNNERDLRNVNQNVKKARDRGYDEELRLQYEEAKAGGYEDQASNILETMKKSSDAVVADIAATIKKGGTPQSSQALQLATRRKISSAEPA